MNIKTGDTVKVIAGKDKGAQGEVLFAFPEKGRVTVQGVNLVHKALRPTQANPNGGTIPAKRLSTSPTSCWSARRAACPTRIGFKVDEGGKVRVCKKCGKVID